MGGTSSKNRLESPLISMYICGLPDLVDGDSRMKKVHISEGRGKVCMCMVHLFNRMSISCGLCNAVI